jgi:hypothetical protein
MNKKYTIVNSNLNGVNECIDNLFYIIIFILLIYLATQIFSINYKENFLNTEANIELKPEMNTAIIATASAQPITPKVNLVESKPVEQKPEMNTAIIATASAQPITPKVNLVESKPVEQKLTIEQELQEAKSLANTLKVSKETLEESIKKQARALYLANNYYKIDDSSFNDQSNFINNDFMDVKLPKSDFKNKILISTQAEYNDFIAKASNYKNLYKVGDVVVNPSNYNITKDNICYKDYEKHLAIDPEFKQKYPECMVCSINPNTDYKNTKSWEKTKTNIHKVCLFNSNAPNDSSILNYDGCKKLCSNN